MYFRGRKFVRLHIYMYMHKINVFLTLLFCIIVSLQQRLRNVDSWDFNIFAFSRITGGKILVYIDMMYIVHILYTCMHVCGVLYTCITVST